MRTAAERAIKARFVELTALKLDRDDRFHTLRPLIVRTVPDDALAAAVQDVTRGDGHELDWSLRADLSWRPPSLHSAYSSCGTAINAFGPWRLNAAGVPIADGKFDTCEFEVKLPIRTLETRRSPNLDVVLASNDQVVAIESKLLETLAESKAAEYPPSYEAAVASLDIDRSWDALYRSGHEQFCYVGVGQLVRHYLGLKTQLGEGGILEKQSRAKLLYLYWEPEGGHPIIERHREEVAILRRDLRDASIQFEARSYRDLWDEWATSADHGVREHAIELEQRYAVHADPD